MTWLYSRTGYVDWYDYVNMLKGLLMHATNLYYRPLAVDQSSLVDQQLEIQ